MRQKNPCVDIPGRSKTMFTARHAEYAYYNDNDPFVAAWMKKLAANGHIPKGYVDERSIENVSPDDIQEFTHAHFFA